MERARLELGEELGDSLTEVVIMEASEIELVGLARVECGRWGRPGITDHGRFLARASPLDCTGLEQAASFGGDRLGVGCEVIGRIQGGTRRNHEVQDQRRPQSQHGRSGWPVNRRKREGVG